MNEKVKKLINGQEDNHILPFFWQHGETEDVLREYMGVIKDCGIGAVCVESRPHPDFCGPGWWHDMDIILDEARQRNMKVWILDDSHFPTGYANGAMAFADPALAKRSVVYERVDCGTPGSQMTLDLTKYRSARPWQPTAMEKQYGSVEAPPEVPGDAIIGISLIRDGGNADADIIDLTPWAGEAQLTVTVPPEGRWGLYICHSTRNRGTQRDYINMMDHASCRLLIDAVYEPHYAHYARYFGNTLAGFFSDEPGLGNGHNFDHKKHLSQMDDLPWSRELAQALEKRWGADYGARLPLIWDIDFDAGVVSRIRYEYMDCVTRLVEQDFSRQMGDWCRAHGVCYIGHVIEDDNQHARTGSSLGHYFRGLYGQDMAGIDDIGGQVKPGGEGDSETPGFRGICREGDFYHYVLGKLASSAASIEPLKKGRSMCEIFGAYGWGEGVRLEKYLTDHFLVKGINHFVPHAFSAKAFPDPDCPPHFYAHGHNPQYRHFGALMGYMNRVCELMSDGHCVTPVAMLYMGEAEWTGDFMRMQKPARVLTDAQIDFEILPADVFEQPEAFHTKIGSTLKVNGQEYRTLVIPRTRFLCPWAAAAIPQLLDGGMPVVFVDALPESVAGGRVLPFDTDRCLVVPLEALAQKLTDLGMAEVHVSPANDRIRYRHYENGASIYMFINEGAQPYHGEITVAASGAVYAYNAWDNRLETVDARPVSQGTGLWVDLEPLKSLIVVFDQTELQADSGSLQPPLTHGIHEKERLDFSDGWTRSICESIAYPDFVDAEVICVPDVLEQEKPEFSGFVRYEKTLQVDTVLPQMILEITDAYEGVEVFVNDISAGLQIVPTYRYDITPYLHEGENLLRIEVATTLERAAMGFQDMLTTIINKGQPSTVPSGINGKIYLING